jgi:hypothetical protein
LQNSMVFSHQRPEYLIMTNKQDITVLKGSPRSYRLSMGGLKACKPLAQGIAGVARCRQPGPEKALKERYQQHMATPCTGNAPLAMKPQRGVIRLISFDHALTGLSDIVHPRFVGRCPTLLITLFQSLALPCRGRKIMVIVKSSERAISLAQGNALCRSKHIRTKPQRGVIRYISFDYALTGLSDIVRPRFVGRCRRCPTLNINVL